LELVRDAIDTSAIQAVTVGDITFEDRTRRARVRLGSPLAPTPQLAVAPRAVFDGALLAAAVGAGATLRADRVRHVSWEDNGWRIVTERESTRAPWVFGADGPNSLVRRRIGRPFARADLSIATGFFVHGVASSTVAIVFEDAPPGYLWSFPRSDHLAVGICAQADTSRASALLAAASAWIGRNIHGALELERYSWPIPSLRLDTLERERPCGPRWMLLGDAAGMVDPITREGIFFCPGFGGSGGQQLSRGWRSLRALCATGSIACVRRADARRAHQIPLLQSAIHCAAFARTRAKCKNPRDHD